MSVTRLGNGSLSRFIALENIGSILSTSCNLLPGRTEITVESSFNGCSRRTIRKSTKIDKNQCNQSFTLPDGSEYLLKPSSFDS